MYFLFVVHWTNPAAGTEVWLEKASENPHDSGLLDPCTTRATVQRDRVVSHIVRRKTWRLYRHTNIVLCNNTAFFNAL